MRGIKPVEMGFSSDVMHAIESTRMKLREFELGDIKGGEDDDKIVIDDEHPLMKIQTEKIAKANDRLAGLQTKNEIK